jgi:hypothetical protein
MSRRAATALLLPLLALAACRDDRAPAPEASATAGAPPAPATTAGLGRGASDGAKPAVPAATNGGNMVKVGDPAPAFKAPDHTGQMRSLADYRGKRVVLWFYPKASTGG